MGINSSEGGGIPQQQFGGNAASNPGIGGGVGLNSQAFDGFTLDSLTGQTTTNPLGATQGVINDLTVGQAGGIPQVAQVGQTFEGLAQQFPQFAQNIIPQLNTLIDQRLQASLPTNTAQPFVPSTFDFSGLSPVRQFNPGTFNLAPQIANPFRVGDFQPARVRTGQLLASPEAAQDVLRFAPRRFDPAPAIPATPAVPTTQGGPATPAVPATPHPTRDFITNHTGQLPAFAQEAVDRVRGQFHREGGPLGRRSSSPEPFSLGPDQANQPVVPREPFQVPPEIAGLPARLEGLTERLQGIPGQVREQLDTRFADLPTLTEEVQARIAGLPEQIQGQVQARIGDVVNNLPTGPFLPQGFPSAPPQAASILPPAQPLSPLESVLPRVTERIQGLPQLDPEIANRILAQVTSQVNAAQAAQAAPGLTPEQILANLPANVPATALPRLQQALQGLPQGGVIPQSPFGGLQLFG